MLKRSLIAAAAALLLATGAHAAATLATAPFPGRYLAAGFAVCAVTNVGTKAGTVTLVLVDHHGGVVGTTGPVTVAPGETQFGNAASPSNGSPTACRITVPSKARFRGSLDFVSSNTAAPTVIPAQ